MASIYIGHHFKFWSLNCWNTEHVSAGTTDKSTTYIIYALWLCLHLKFQTYGRKPPQIMKSFHLVLQILKLSTGYKIFVCPERVTILQIARIYFLFEDNEIC